MRGDPDIQRALQAETATRKRKIAEVRQEDADARDRLQERKLELKVASEARLAASHAAKEAAALARAADAAAKTHRQALAASAKEASAAAQKAEEVAKAAKDKEKKKRMRRLWHGERSAVLHALGPWPKRFASRFRTRTAASLAKRRC